MSAPQVGKKYKCKRCGKSWKARTAQRPRCCGVCKTAYWDRELIIERRRGKKTS